MRYRLIIEYDGTPFCGWQSQANGVAVQDVLGAAIRAFCGEDVTIYGAGRTDAGVHARGQVAHIDLPDAPEAETLRDAVNFHLKPHPVSLLAAFPAAPDFDARFSATKRHYRYRILARRAPPTLERAQSWWVPRPLDVEAMRAACAHLVGHHDFTTFRALRCQAASPVRTLERLDILHEGEIVELHAAARSFLHTQVRSMAGALVAVGTGKWQADDLAAALAAKNREAAAEVAPPQGLCLMKVDYPADALEAK